MNDHPEPEITVSVQIDLDFDPFLAISQKDNHDALLIYPEFVDAFCAQLREAKRSSERQESPPGSKIVILCGCGDADCAVPPLTLTSHGNKRCQAWLWLGDSADIYLARESMTEMREWLDRQLAKPDPEEN